MSKLSRLCSFIKNSTMKTEFPGIVNFDITSRCNLNCEHCYWRKTYDPDKEYSDAEWIRIFTEFRQKGVRSAFLTGGEPSLRLDVIRAAYDIFDSITIVSNGIIPIPADIKTRIFVSIDGPREIHNRIRGGNVFDKIMDNIRGDKRVVLTPTLTSTNFIYIEELVQITRDAQVEGITFSTYASHEAENDPLLLHGETLNMAAEKLKNVWKNNKDIVLLSPKIINQFLTKDFHKKCYLRDRKKIVSYDAQLRQKEPCVLGAGVNCATCGCIVPIMAYTMSRADARSWLIFDRLYSEAYY